MSEILPERIEKLKQQRNAVILAHNYQPGEIQDLADYTGDSLGLSVQASQTQADVIVFCGVRFMAETAAILSPEKTVLLPEENAGCPMAKMITAEELRKLKEKHPDAIVVCYVNTTAEVKAESDYCCTSANAVDLVKTLPADREIIFVPDQHLGRFVEQRCGIRLILWPGYCATHLMITEQDILEKRKSYPDAVVLSHPECSEDAKAVSDELLSTGQMLKFVQSSGAKQFIIATEVGIIHSLKKENPDAQFFAANERAICPNMKKITLEKILWSLEDMQHEVRVPAPIAERATKAINRMVAVLP